MSTDGAGHGGHGGLGSDIGHSSGLDNADLGVGHGHGHHGGAGHHHGGHDFQGKVTIEALMVAHSYCGFPGFHSFGHVDSTVDAHSGMPDHGHVGSWSTGDGVDPKSFLRSNESFLKAVEKAKNDPLRRDYGVHVMGHGRLDVPKIFCRLATELGAIRVCGTTGNFNPTDVVLNDITDWAKFAPPYLRKRPPAGWYVNADGDTHIWRQYWQVGPRRYWWQPTPKGRPVYDRSQLTYLEVQVVTWYFAAIGDYETRVDLRIVSAPILDRTDKTWNIRGKPLAKHQILSKGIEQGLFKALTHCPPTDYARRRRAKLIELQTTQAEKVASSGADLDSLFASYKERQSAPQTGSPADASTTTGGAAAGPGSSAATVGSTPPAPAASRTYPVPEPTPAPQATGKSATVHVEIPPPVLRNKR